MVRIMATMTEGVDPILTITDEARAKILEVRAGESDADSLALRVAVSGESAGAFTYDMELIPLVEAADDDVVQRHDDLSFVIAADSVEKIAGATLDFTGAGMVMNNPNRPTPQSASPLGDRPDADLSGELPQRVIAVLEEQINPAIAAHGGFAELVAVEDNVAYLRMGGGCQGCGLAAVTLTQGIEVAILDTVPEIEKVVDVTDHASGSNPYFESAKK
jgi:Fe/S biogenesis protein NfuA